MRWSFGRRFARLLASRTHALARLGTRALGLQRVTWFGAGMSAGVAAWLVGEVALGPIISGHPPPPPRPIAPPLRVQVDGAVERPGIYELPPGARVEDALRVAGGVAERGDPSELNLVARLTDGQRVSVPARPPPGSAATATPPRPRPFRTPTPGALARGSSQRSPPDAARA